MISLIIKNADSSQRVDYKVDLPGDIDINIEQKGRLFTILDLSSIDTTQDPPINDQWGPIDALTAMGSPNKPEVFTIQDLIEVVENMSLFGLFIANNGEPEKGEVEIIPISMEEE